MESKTFLKKIDEAKSRIGKLSKDSENPFHKSKYFDINQLLDNTESILRECGLMVMQPIVDGHVVSQIIDPETGELRESSLKLPELNDPQKIGSAITYYRRYTLQSLLALQAEDDDANKASGKGDGNNQNKGQNQQNQSEDNRPWMTEKQYKDCMARISKGEVGVYEKANKAFKIKKEYRTAMQYAERSLTQKQAA